RRSQIKMFFWVVEASSVSHAKSETIWKLLENVEGWPLWDDTLEAAHLEGPFLVGSIGWVKRKESTSLPMKLSFVEKNKRFGMLARRFSTTIAYTYQLHPFSEGDTCITARVVVGGLLAPIYRLTVAKKLRKTLPRTLDALGKKATNFS